MRRLPALVLLPMTLAALMACGDGSDVSFCELAADFEQGCGRS